MAWTPGSLASPDPLRIAGGLAAPIGPIAIEFRDAHVRLLQLVARRDRPVYAAACLSWDPDRPAACADALLAALRGEGFRLGRCVVGLPFAAVRAETMTVPESEDAIILEDLARRAPWRHGIALPQLGMLRLGPCGEGRVDIALVVADRERIEAFVHPLIDRNVLPDAAEPSFIAAARACSLRHRRAADRERVRVAVDVHAEGAIAMLLAGDRIVHCASVDDRDDIPGAIAVCMHDGGPHALERAAEVRLVGRGSDDPSLVKAIEAACDAPVRTEDDDWSRLRDAIGVRGDAAGGAAAWAGAFGLASRSIPAASGGLRRAA